MILDLNKWHNALSDMKQRYQQAPVFPHIAIDQFLDADTLQQAAADFPPISGDGWIHYQHVNEDKGGLNKRDLIPPRLLAIIDRLNSPDFVAWLSELTGIPNLVPDTALEGGGLHQIERGGFLNIHADFTVHPHHRMWRRRVNVLVYLNDDWQDSFGGHLELWTRDMKQCFEKIRPDFNRCVIFNTDFDSYHGHPTPLACPEDRTRRSIALYYFTVENKPPGKVATNYRARPEDGLKSLLIYLDKQALALYNAIKGATGINDEAVSKILRWVGKLRGRR
ncbi:MAG: 2OG-Fe(II) oxygenase [Alphaproteobacteria bacterium]|nr:2OG-Fe(II) oxygenase [Alphaproteobacteria bacterium]